MFKVNENFLNLSESYLFSTIAKEVEAYRSANPDASVIRMGIGDVTRPLPPSVISAMSRAVADMADASTFHGYGPEQGYAFLRDAIALNDYRSRGINISSEEIFISDGAKSDTANILDILAPTNRVALTDPVYPVYLDSNIMSGKMPGKGGDASIVTLPCTETNGFVPDLPAEGADIIYLCYPNNPTGTTLTRDQLAVFVDYAIRNNSLILFDSAYEAFITEDNIPHSIYEIEGAETCAIEFRSFSKTAGFTGVRCGYTVVPRALKATIANGSQVSLRSLWNRRQTTRFNGASYISQRGAEAIYTPQGKAETCATIDYYLNNARILKSGLESIGLTVYGGVNAPYVWAKAPTGMNSWDFFHLLLQRYSLVCTPGVGFGDAGEGFVRFTAFNTETNTTEAIERLKSVPL